MGCTIRCNTLKAFSCLVCNMGEIICASYAPSLVTCTHEMKNATNLTIPRLDIPRRKVSAAARHLLVLFLPSVQFPREPGPWLLKQTGLLHRPSTEYSSVLQKPSTMQQAINEYFSGISLEAIFPRWMRRMAASAYCVS